MEESTLSHPMKAATKKDWPRNTLLMVAILFGISTCQTLNVHGAEHARIELYSDVQYLATTPSECSSWMLTTTSIDARRFYSNREDCTSRSFPMGVSRSDLFSYVGRVRIGRIISTSDCCIQAEVDDHSGWVVRDLLDVAPEQRAVYDAHLAEERRDAEEQRKKDAAEASRRKRADASRAEQNAQYAKYKAEEDAKAAEERRKLRAACTAIYHDTIDKKVKDLTVREEQQVRACQALGLYPPK